MIQPRFADVRNTVPDRILSPNSGRMTFILNVTDDLDSSSLTTIEE